MAEQKYSNILVSSRADGKLAYTDNLYDKSLANNQENINKNIIDRLEALEGKLNITQDAKGRHIWTVGSNKYLLTPYADTDTPVLQVTPSSITFNGNVGSEYTNTFTVIGTNLTNVVNVSISDSSIYSINVNTISIAQATIGYSVTVTYKPTAIGSSSAVISITSDGATGITMPVIGTAVAVSTPVINASKTAINLSCYAGETVTDSFVVSGTNLNENISIASSGSSDISVDVSSISVGDAENGVEVTVTYNPSVVGNSTKTLTLSSDGANSVNVTISCSAIAVPVPTISVNKTSIALNCYSTDTASTTFIVTGENLTDDISIVGSVGSGELSLSNYSISKEDAVNGYAITVTFAPTGVGSVSRVFTISSQDADSIDVTVTGVATAVPVPTISVDTSSIKFYGSPNETDSKTVVVTGVNLTGPINVSNSSSYITTSTSTISAASAAQGYNLTIDYNAGSTPHSGIDDIVLTTEGGETVTISIEYDAEIESVSYAKPVITEITYPNVPVTGKKVSPTSLKFTQIATNTWSDGNTTSTMITEEDETDAVFTYALTNASNGATVDADGKVGANASSSASLNTIGIVTPQVTVNGETSTNSSVTATIKQVAATCKFSTNNSTSYTKSNVSASGSSFELTIAKTGNVTIPSTISGTGISGAYNSSTNILTVTVAENTDTTAKTKTLTITTSINTLTVTVNQVAATVKTYFYIGQTYNSVSGFAALTSNELIALSTKTVMEEGTPFSGNIGPIRDINAYEHVTAIDGTTVVGSETKGNNTYFIMIPSSINIQAVLLYTGIELDYPFTAEQVTDADYWESQHDAITIDGITYNVYGYRNAALYGYSMKLYIN